MKLLKFLSVGVSVNRDLMINIILLIIAIFLLVIYMIYILVNERKNWNKPEFFKYTLYYEVDYFLYMDMLKKMKKVLLKKRLELLWLNFLLLLRRFIIWKKN